MVTVGDVLDESTTLEEVRELATPRTVHGGGGKGIVEKLTCTATVHDGMGTHHRDIFVGLHGF